MPGKIVSFLSGLFIAGIAVFLIMNGNNENNKLDINKLNGNYKVYNQNIKSTVKLEDGNFKQKTSNKHEYVGKVNLYKSNGKVYYILQSSNSQNVFMYEFKNTKKGFDAKRIVQGGKVIETNHYVKIFK